ncbi:histidine triad nucleotide-binding protein 3-like [Asbolus verrucosus]|uniref:Adenosine 5'-monophosphoramidase HINT3 n=1 Tax=Asbolus verrucosus TaxID=1661398 RepID=A0A482VZA3_ASBVE|nr:histidine triad nucleotide-binding protein 3-like [Asbolus verrucosus]
MSHCIFCKIISGDAPGEIFYQDDEVTVFKDIKPASNFHFLAVPKEHILADKGGDVDDVRLGFHLPPFNSIAHLHLHVISPASGMSTLSRLIFKPNTWWFSSVIVRILF